MNIHLHHAQTAALNAAMQLSSAAWAAKLTGCSLEEGYLKEAAKQLLNAANELEKYNALHAPKAEAA